MSSTSAGQAAKLAEYIQLAAEGRSIDVDWTNMPWQAAQPALHWLGIAPQLNQKPQAPPMPVEIALLCDAMAKSFISESDCLIWSSYRISSAIDVVASCLASVPEPLIQSLWNHLRMRELDISFYQFCRAWSRELLSRYRQNPAWDLGWMLVLRPTPAEACFRYWTLGLKPGLWNNRAEQATLAVLREYPFLSFPR